MNAKGSPLPGKAAGMIPPPEEAFPSGEGGPGYARAG